MDLKSLRRFRNNLRILERELDIQNKSCCCCGVTLAQCHVLLELDKSNNLTLNQLSEKLSLDKSSVSKTVESLVKTNLLFRNVPEEDRRVTILSLTGEGISVCKKINRSNDEYFRLVFRSLPKDDIPAFLTSFETLVQTMRITNK